MNNIHSFPVRVYWEDTDAGGIVYHANYIKFMERARSDWLRGLAFDQNAQRSREDGVLFVVASLEIAYKRAAVLDDDLCVRTTVERLGPASIIFKQDIFRNEELLTSGRVRIGAINALTMKPTVIPRELSTKIKTLSSD